MNERKVALDSVTLNVAVSAPNGPPMLLLHGVTRRWQDFRSLFPELADHFQLHGIDLRGHGKSGRTTGNYRVIEYVPDVVRYLQLLEEPAIVVGHSLGGMVAAAVAAAAPDRVAALVLEDPTFEMTGRRIYETTYPDLFRAFRRHAGSTRSIRDIAADLAGAMIYAPDAPVYVRLGQLRDPVSLRFSAACLKRLDPDVLTTPLEGRWLEGYNVESTLARINCPTLFLQADWDAGGSLPDDYAETLAAMIPDAARVKLTGIGHNIHGTQPNAMLRLMTPFLDSLD